MVRLFAVVILVSFIFTTTSTILFDHFKNSPFILMVIFILNSVVLIFGSLSISQKNNLAEKDEITEKSVSIFIRIFIYLLPILTLVGLYLLNKMGKLGMEEANTWVSFILGIAAFVMSLITLWQGEGTYNKIFAALKNIEEKTNSIEKDQASMAAAFQMSRPQGLQLDKEAVFEVLSNQQFQGNEEETDKTNDIISASRNTHMDEK